MVRWLAVFVLLLVGLGSAFADGKFFRQRLIESEPSIPFQRAVLKFDGKEQVMMVESNLSGPQGTYGWVIPLPTKPSYVKAVNPAYLEQSFNLVKPQILGSREIEPSAVVAALVFTLIVLSSGLRYKKHGLGMRVFYFAAEFALLFIIYMILFPVFASSKMAARSNAAMAEAAKGIAEDLGQIGSYQVSVLSGESGSEILDWLKEHDLAADDSALPVIEAYAKEGWCFLAAEIRKNKDGAYPPHPLKAVFPTDKLIYPMRLTGLQEEPLQLELLVVSNKEAQIEGMKPWACDNRPLRIPIGINSAQDKEIYSDWRSGEYAMAKHGMVWTYLRGEFKPDAMKKDFGVDWRPMQKQQAEIWDRAGAQREATKKGLFYLCCASLVVGLILICWSGVTDRVFGIGALVALMVAFLWAVSWYQSVEKVESEVSTERDNYQRLYR